MLRLRTTVATGLPQGQTTPRAGSNDEHPVAETAWGQTMVNTDIMNFDSRCQDLTIDRSLGLDSDDVALAMCIASHCVDGAAGWVPEQIQSQGNGCLFAALKVLGKITYLQTWSDPDGSAAVWRGYLDAVRLLNSALASPSESRTDSTLLATLIMSAIETKAAPSRSSEYWEVHTKGAAALLELRGADQDTSRLGSALYFQATSHMVTACILSGRRIPEDLHVLRKATRAFLVDPSHPVWKYQGAMFRLTDFVAATRTGASELEDQDYQHILSEAGGIHTELLGVFRDASLVWQYECIPTERFRGLVGHEHVYRSGLAA